MKNNISYLLICRELHKDGTPHIHALIVFTKKVDIKDQHYFDIQSYHPNIQTVKHLKKSINYIKKDGNFIEEGDILEHEARSRELPPFDKSMSRLQWFTICFEHKLPYQYALEFWNLNTTSDINTITTVDKDTLKYVTSPLLKIMIPKNDHLKSYVIVGPSGCGKTTWAKYHCEKPCLWISHMDDLRKFRPGFHQSLVFDDMKFTHLDPVLQIPILDRYDQRSLHLRYTTASIPAGIPKYFTCNEIPFSNTLPQISRRMTLINLY